MPAKGTVKLPPMVRAKVIAQKRIDGVKATAQRTGLAIATVTGLEGKASDEVLAMADDFQAAILEKARKNVSRGMDIIGARIENPKEPLAAVNQAVKISHEISRLESGQSTSNVASGNDAQRFFEFMAGKFSREEAARKLLESSIGSVEDRERIYEAEVIKKS